MADGNTTDRPVLDIENVSLAYRLGRADLTVVRDATLRIEPGEAVGLVGESGSGKSTLAFGIMGYLGATGRITNGRIRLEGRDLTKMTPEALREVRGNRIAMIYQEPMSSLNPLMTIGRQLMEVPLIHENVTADEARDRAIEMIREVDLPDPEWLFTRYPHQLSGGQQQRVVIAMALMAKPALLVMDEPTTALDVTIEAGVLALVRDLRRRFNMGILFISHNLRTVAQVCDRVAVLYAGDIVEQGDVETVFANPSHPYTIGLIDCLPTLEGDKDTTRLRPIPGQVPKPSPERVSCLFMDRCEFAEEGRCDSGGIPLVSTPGNSGHLVKCARLGEFARPDRSAVVMPGSVDETTTEEESVPVLSLRNVVKTFSQTRGIVRRTKRTVTALNDIDLEVDGERTLAIVGESGSGKSTLARAICGLAAPDSGVVLLDGQDVGPLDERTTAIKRKLQMVFQNPDSTLNPSHTIGFALERTLLRLGEESREVARKKVRKILEKVRLPADIVDRYPEQLSGGQKQRIGIARALIASPEIVLADEPVSALDVSVQAAVVNLLSDLQKEFSTTLVFISHDLSVVRHISDKVVVMYLGNIVEYGPVDQVFEPPYHPYTEALLSAVPSLDPSKKTGRIVLDSAAIRAPSHGCSFAPRCPRSLGGLCENTTPPHRKFANEHLIACHISPESYARGVGDGL